MRSLHFTAYNIKNSIRALLALCLFLPPLPAVHAQESPGVTEGAGIARDSYAFSSVVINDSLLSVADEELPSASGFDGALKIRSVELAEYGDSLSLVLELRVKREAVNKRQSWAIVPQLVAKEGNSKGQVTFPYALVNGGIREKLYKRKLNFGNRELLGNLPCIRTKISGAANSDVLLHYSIQVPYEPWMDAADLKLHAILVSPAGKRQLLTMENAGRVTLSSREPYEVQPLVNFTEPDPEQKHRKMQGQAYLDFQVGRSVIIPTFRRNPEELTKIAQAVASVRANPDASIKGLFIEGYASPEGSYATNEKLAHARSEALREHMVLEHGFERELFRVNSVAEDWDGLRILVQESSLNESQKQNALSIIDSNDGYDQKEARLRAQGAAWRLMNTEMFPQLRRVEYQIDFAVKDYTLEESRALAGRNPEMLSQRELFLLAMSYPKGSKKREETLELIGRMYPDDTVASINTAALMLSRGEHAAARRMLERVGDDSRALNNLGVYHLMAGELDKAQDCLDRAAGMGIEEAAHNMEELKKKIEDNEKMKRYQR